jgi:hypothetical protein
VTIGTRAKALVGVVAALGAARLMAQAPSVFLPRDHDAIQYAAPPSADPIEKLSQQIQRGGARLAFEASRGYLESLLTALAIPPASQTLVFSQTSLQGDLIGPASPRALYFNDSTYVGFVRGADTLEIAAHDRTRGVIFYQLRQQPQHAARFERSDRCLQCHLSADTKGVPGVLAMSMLPLSDNPHEYARGWATDHRTPVEDRWGGWYVTGRLVPPRHLGNVPVNHVPTSYVRAPSAPRLASGEGAFDTRPYLTPHSDVVALLVLNHQMHMTNLLTRLGWLARLVEAGAGPRRTAEVSGGEVDAAARELVDYLVFADEAPLPSAVQGSSSFAEEFAARGPRDQRGRSLRDFELRTRLFRHPCSYMIYTAAFDALLPSAKAAVYRRLWDVLSGADRNPVYARLTPADRRAVVEILRETKKDLPIYFDPAAL